MALCSVVGSSLYLQASTTESFNPESFNCVQAELADKRPKWAKFLKKYGTSCSIGVVIGAGTGAGSHCLDNHIPFFINWFIWMSIREKSVEVVSADLSRYAIEHDKTIVQNVAWISDWLTYLALRGFLTLKDK